MSNIVLIGANGQLGTDLALIGTDFPLFPLNYPEIDITRREELHQKLKELNPSVIINTAAVTDTGYCEEDPDTAFRINATGTKNLVDFCKERDCTLIHISTDYVFDGRKIDKREPYTEEEIPNPINMYGITKYAGELIVRNYLEKFYIIRVASLYGKAGAYGKGGNFVYSILKKAREESKLKVVNDVYMTPTYTMDVANKIWEMIKNGGFPYGVYHMTNQGIATWYDFAVAIVKYAGIECEIEPVSHREFPSKINRPIWSPLTSIRGTNLRPWEQALYDFIKSLPGDQ